MNLSSQLTKDIFEFLNATTNYAVLRNYEGLPLNNSSRDIDLLIDKKQFFIYEKEIIRIIEAHGFKISTRYRSEKMVAYVFAYISNGRLQLLEFDFLFETSYYGIYLLPAKSMLAQRTFNGSVYHVSKEHEFLDKYLWLKALGFVYPAKYNHLKENVVKSESLKAIISDTIKYIDFNELDKSSSYGFVVKQLLKNLKSNPVKQISNIFIFMYYHILNTLNYKGFSLGFTGPDGSGKTTIIDIISVEFSKVYSKIEYHHFRPHIIPNLGEAVYSLKLKPEVDDDFSNPHRGDKKSVLNSFVRLMYYSIDYIVGYFQKIRPVLQKRSIIIFDRYFTDLIADSRRNSIFLNHKFIYQFGRFFIPSLDYNILLSADSELILLRKQELTKEGIEVIDAKLKYLAGKNSYNYVLNNTIPEDAVDEILKIILNGQHRLNKKK